MELWQFKVSVVTFDDLKLLRFTDRAARTIFSGCSYKDIDICGSTKRPELLGKAEQFIRRLGFGFPVPMGTEAARKIYSFEVLPSYDDWVRFKGEEGYSQLSYRTDGARWWQQKMLAKTHEELSRWLILAARRLQAKSRQDRAAYAVQLVRRFNRELERLNNYYGAREISVSAGHALGELNALISVSGKGGQLVAGQTSGSFGF